MAKSSPILRARVAVDASGLRLLSSAAKQRTVTTRMARSGGKVVQRAAKPLAPRRKGSGALRRSLGVKAKRGTRGKTISYAVVGPRKSVRKTITLNGNKAFIDATDKSGKATRKAIIVGGRQVTVVPAFYAHLVEKGTRPHSLGRGSLLARRGKGGAGQGAGKRHPGARPRPFLGPAYEGSKDAVRAVMLRTAADEVQKELVKAARKAAAKARGAK